MTRTRRRLAALVATFALILTALTLGQFDTARADDFCDFEDQAPPTITALKPAVITLGLEPQPVQFSIDATDECGIPGWSIDTPGKVLFFVYKEIPEDTIYPPANKNAGPTPVDVRAIDQAYNQQKRRLTLRLLRETRWQTNEVTSAPVEKGSRIPIKATLKRADWNKNAYVRYGERKQQATVQFKAAGSDTWVPVKTVKFSAKGRISTHVTVKREVARDGWYRLRFHGTANSSSATSTPDYVDVR
jgi:hypothetical protein